MVKHKLEMGSRLLIAKHIFQKVSRRLKPLWLLSELQHQKPDTSKGFSHGMSRNTDKLDKNWYTSTSWLLPTGRGRVLGVSDLDSKTDVLVFRDILTRHKVYAIEPRIARKLQFSAFHLVPAGSALIFICNSNPKSSTADCKRAARLPKTIRVLLLKQDFLLPRTPCRGKQC
jgi:hypothetical protein